MHFPTENKKSLQNGFTTATSIQKQSANSLKLQEAFQVYLCGFLESFESSTVTLLEGDKRGIKTVHTELHHLMVRAVENNWDVRLIDIANCFDPQLVSTLCFENGINPHKVLQYISLARPFQMYQSASIIKQLKQKLSGKKHKRRQLIIVTCISSQFFDESLASEDPNYPLPQLDLLRHTLGALQSLATQGHTIVMTDLVESIASLTKNSKKHTTRVQNTSLSYVSKIHLRISHNDTHRRVELLNHPFLSAETTTVKLLKHEIFIDIKQKSLDEWF
jgi:hypothetical protein